MSLSFSETPSHIVIPTRVSLSGYGAILHSIVSDLNLLNGANILALAAVPVGVLHIYTSLGVRYDGTVATVYLSCNIFSGAVPYNLFCQAPPVSTIEYDRQGFWVLAAGDVLRLGIDNATAGDDAYLYATGFVVDLT
jgi:hypothetical protein